VSSELPDIFIDVVVQFEAAIDLVDPGPDDMSEVVSFNAYVTRDAVPCDETYRKRKPGEDTSDDLIITSFSDGSYAWGDEVDIDEDLLYSYGAHDQEESDGEIPDEGFPSFSR